MKQIQFYFLLILLLPISSCDTDRGDPDDYYHPYAFLEGVFPDSATGRELILVSNGETVKNKKVQIVSRGSKEKPQAVLTFENVIDGEVRTEIRTGLTETANPDNSETVRVEFQGVYSVKSRTVI
ncbi:MAG: hypothetical protein LBU37_01325 [Tannerellaceae bacterium]|jgi:hypothetical protein|nr:hypothetical protein [Tannerellaceae bacterium]